MYALLLNGFPIKVINNNQLCSFCGSCTTSFIDEELVQLELLRMIMKTVNQKYIFMYQSFVIFNFFFLEFDESF